MSEEKASPSVPMRSSRRSLSPEIFGAGVLALVLLIFIVQNSNDVNVHWLVFSKRAEVWVVIIVSAVLGYLIGQLIEFSLKRRRRNHLKNQNV